MSDRWLRVSRQTPCHICDKGDWCTLSTDGSVACCMRTESDSRVHNGGWLHRLTDKPGLQHNPIKHEMKTSPLAPIEQRDSVYRALLAELGLSESHRRHLLEVRGLPDSTIANFATLPLMDRDERRALAVCVAERARSHLNGIPGFYSEQGHWALVKTPVGFLIAVPNAHGQIQGLQIRADRPRSGAPRYTWLSSARWSGGVSSGAPVAVWRPELACSCTAWIIEGALKGLIASHLLPACVCAVPGVASWRAVLPILRDLGASIAVVAYDSDAATKPEVGLQRDALALALNRAGFKVKIASWNPSRKGIDDALLARAPISVDDWRRQVGQARVTAPHCHTGSIRLPDPARLRGITMPTARRHEGVSLSDFVRRSG